MLRYQLPWLVLVILIPFFWFQKINKKLSSFLFWGYLSGILFVYFEYNFLINISYSIFLWSIIFYGFLFFTPIFLLFYIIKKYAIKYDYFFSILTIPIGFWLYNFGFTHYPLFSPLDGLSNYPVFLQVCDLGGIYFSIFLLSIINFLIFNIFYSFFKNKSIKKINYKKILLLVLIIISIYGYGIYKQNLFRVKIDINKDEQVKNILLVQTNITEQTKDDYKRSVENSMKLEKKLTVLSPLEFVIEGIIGLTESSFESEEKIDLVVWPEKSSATHLFMEDAENSLIPLEKEWFNRVFHFINENNLTILASTHVNSFINPKLSYNAAVMLEPQKNNNINQFYYKNKLFIFGEYFPEISFLNEYRKKFGFNNLLSGEKINTFKLGDIIFGVNICFENGFSEIARIQKKQGATFIINVSNDDLFKSIKELRYQESNSIIRAIENKVYYLRATNIGLTEVINPIGEIEDKITPYTEGFLLAKINSNNFESFYSNFGYLSIYILVFIYIFLWITLFVRRDD